MSPRPPSSSGVQARSPRRQLVDLIEKGVEQQQPLRALELVIEGLDRELPALGDELGVELLPVADLGLLSPNHGWETKIEMEGRQIDVLAPALGPLREPGSGHGGRSAYRRAEDCGQRSEGGPIQVPTPLPILLRR